MSMGTMTSKGQITVPKEIREDLGLTPGTRVNFTRNEAGEVILARAGGSLMDLAGSIKYTGEPVTLEAMEDAIAGGSRP